MPTVPTGAPGFVRSNDFTTYGGHPEKRNFQAQGSTDPTTDVSAEQFSRLVEDVAGLARVAKFCTITLQLHDASPADPTVLYYDAMMGGAPTCTRLGNGNVRLQFAASYADQYGVSGAFNIAHVKTSVQFATPAIPNHAVSDSNADTFNDRIEVKIVNLSNVAIQDAILTVSVSTSTP